MVDSRRHRRTASARRPAIAAPKKTQRTRARTRRAPARITSKRPRRAPSQSDHPIGEGVADAWALERLSLPSRRKRAPKEGVRELGWAVFGEVASAFASQIARRYRPAVVVGIAKGGVFVGAVLASVLGCDFYPVRIENRRRDRGTLPETIQELPDLTGKRVLVVDDVASTGATLARARALARKAGAKEVRSAVLVSRPRGARPDFAAFATDELVLFGWDYQLDGAGPEDPGEVGV